MTEEESSQNKSSSPVRSSPQPRLSSSAPSPVAQLAKQLVSAKRGGHNNNNNKPSSSNHRQLSSVANTSNNTDREKGNNDDNYQGTDKESIFSNTFENAINVAAPSLLNRMVVNHPETNTFSDDDNVEDQWDTVDGHDDSLLFDASSTPCLLQQQQQQEQIQVLQPPSPLSETDYYDYNDQQQQQHSDNHSSRLHHPPPQSSPTKPPINNSTHDDAHYSNPKSSSPPMMQQQQQQLLLSNADQQHGTLVAPVVPDAALSPRDDFSDVFQEELVEVTKAVMGRVHIFNNGKGGSGGGNDAFENKFANVDNRQRLDSENTNNEGGENNNGTGNYHDISNNIIASSDGGVHETIMAPHSRPIPAHPTMNGDVTKVPPNVTISNAIAAIDANNTTKISTPASAGTAAAAAAAATTKTPSSSPNSSSDKRRLAVLRRKLRRGGETASPSQSPTKLASSGSGSKGGRSNVDGSEECRAMQSLQLDFKQNHQSQPQSPPQQPQQERHDVTVDHAKNDKAFNQNTSESMDETKSDDPSSSSADIIFARMHKMADRVASGKVKVKKSFLAAAVTTVSANAAMGNVDGVVAKNQSGNDDVDGSDCGRNSGVSDNECDAKKGDGSIAEESAALPPPPPPPPPQRMPLPFTDGESNDGMSQENDNEQIEKDIIENKGFEADEKVDSSTTKNSATVPTTARRRQKMAERLANGKVPIPKAFLEAQQNILSKNNAVRVSREEECSSGDAHASSAGLTALTTEDTIELYPNATMSPQRPSGSLTTSASSIASPPTPSTPNLIISKFDGVEMSLEGATLSGDGEADVGVQEEHNFDTIQLPLPSALDFSSDLPQLQPTVNKNDARRQRRHLRKNSSSTAPDLACKEMAQMSIDGDEIGKESSEQDAQTEFERNGEGVDASNSIRGQKVTENCEKNSCDDISNAVDCNDHTSEMNTLESETATSLPSPVMENETTTPNAGGDSDMKDNYDFGESAGFYKTDASIDHIGSPYDEHANPNIDSPSDEEELHPKQGIDKAAEKWNPTEKHGNASAYDSRSILDHPPSPVHCNSASSSNDVEDKNTLRRAEKKKDPSDQMLSFRDFDKIEGFVDDDEARKLFPPMELHMHPRESFARLNLEPAWDAKDASGLKAALDESKDRDRRSKTGGDITTQPLLELGLSSDEMVNENIPETDMEYAFESGRSLEAASKKLLSQKKRMDIYTNTEGFGVGDDSSVDNEDESEMIGCDDSNNDDDDVDEGNNFNYADIIEADSNSEDDGNNIVGVNKDNDNCIDDDDNDDGESFDAFEFVDFGNGSYDENATAISGAPSSLGANTEENRALRWNRNPDAMSDADDESDIFSKSSVTGGCAVFGVQYLESTMGSNSSFPTPPQSPLDLDPDATPKIGTKEPHRKFFPEEVVPEMKLQGSSNVDNSTTSANPSAKLFKIRPPPPEKVRQWESSKEAGAFAMSRFIAERNSSDDIREKDWQLTKLKSLAVAGTQVPDTARKVEEHSTSPIARDIPSNYKINMPKSPTKKQPNSIVEELDLVSHKRLAEKIAMASSKAAKKFEEEYSHAQSLMDHEAQTFVEERSTNDNMGPSSRFFCAGHSVIGDNISLKQFIPGTAKGSAPVNEEQSMQSADDGSPSDIKKSGALELVGGAFSPWKIPDRADVDSNASSPRLEYDNEMFAHATAAAIAAIHGRHQTVEILASKDYAAENRKSHDGHMHESIETKLDTADDAPTFDADAEINADSDEDEDNRDEEEGKLSGILLWLFEDVLTSNSSIAAAFSAFDIDTSTSVQADRVRAIAKDDESFNMICQYVSSMVMEQHGNKKSDAECQEDFQQNAGSSEDISISTYASSNVTSLCDSSAVASSITESKSSFSQKAAERIFKGKNRNNNGNSILQPFKIPISVNGGNVRPHAEVLAANFASFLQQIALLAKITSPFGEENPFLQSVVEINLRGHTSTSTMQDLVFESDDSIVAIFQFLHKACGSDSKNGATLCAINEDANDDDENETTSAYQHSPESPTSNYAGKNEIDLSQSPLPYDDDPVSAVLTVRRSNKRNNRNRPMNPKILTKETLYKNTNRNLIFPKTSPSPFETAVWNDPSVVLSVLSFLGNPVSVCVMKRLNIFCNRVVCENEHVLIRDAVRLGGLNKFIRPAFWLWVTLDKCKPEAPIPLVPCRRGFEPSTSSYPPSNYKICNFSNLKAAGAAGKWQHVIERDVTRSFGNMPPHKTGARYRQDSIVRALVSFGKEEMLRGKRSHQELSKLPEESEAQHFKLSSRLDRSGDNSSTGSSGSLAPTDTVSDWGGISPVGSMVSEEPSAATAEDTKTLRVVSYEGGQLLDAAPKIVNTSIASKSDVSDPALSGNALTSEMKVDLQNKLRSILHALAAKHEGVGYCQGMDYVVAHLLRVLQDTILLRAIQGSIPGVNGPTLKDNLTSDWRAMPSDQLRSRMNEINSQSEVVEDVVFRVMDTFFTTYNLQHMYWPELRCLKTCCRVFESLIHRKLPVLADHFEHHDLNVGLFALGWFQTLFLYLPSMPSATVCHMWDIWLVERSFKIFFRVGTAILFLSQPTLLNLDLEGMMTYLNTFPDATLLRRDILIPCALQIKITNRMLAEIEMDVTNFNQPHRQTSGSQYDHE